MEYMWFSKPSPGLERLRMVGLASQHPKIIKTLIDSHKITHSYYSPLTCPTQLTQYNSPYNRDIIFGYIGHAQISRWKGIGLAYPTDHKTTVEAIHWARMAAKEDTNTAIILIINHNRSTRSHNKSHSPKNEKCTPLQPSRPPPPPHDTISHHTGMAKILPICITLTHKHTMHT